MKSVAGVESSSPQRRAGDRDVLGPVEVARPHPPRPLGRQEPKCATASESSEKQCRMGDGLAKNTASPRTPTQWHVQHFIARNQAGPYRHGTDRIMSLDRREDLSTECRVLLGACDPL